MKMKQIKVPSGPSPEEAKALLSTHRDRLHGDRVMNPRKVTPIEALDLAIAYMDAAPPGRHEDRWTLLQTARFKKRPRFTATWQSTVDGSTLVRVDVDIVSALSSAGPPGAGRALVCVSGSGINPADISESIAVLTLQLAVAQVAKTMAHMLDALDIEAPGEEQNP